MAKFHGNIGYTFSEETSPGVWTDVITEREYYGDMIRQTKHWEERQQLNDNLTINNRISIVADDFAFSNFTSMRYIKQGDIYFSVSNVEIQRPRLILSVGGVYHGPKKT